MTTTPILATAGAGLALALYFLLVVMRKNEVKQPEAKEQVAKASFKVRRSQLMSISGRGNKNRQKQGNKRGAQQGHRHQNHSSNGQHQPHDDECNWSSWFCKLMSSLKQIILYAVSTISFGYFQSKNDMPPKQGSSGQSSQHIPEKSKKIPTEQSTETYYDDTVVVGMDCEMVGSGRGGWKSLLARCSVVTLDCVPNEASCTQNENTMSNDAATKQTVTSLGQNLVVLYDKYIIPKGKITDYRTEWSGITKDTYTQQSESPIPIVSFNQCQNEISQLFSSIEGKRVIVVGHALENDFDALEIEHPPLLTRDTAFYPPYMRRVRKKLFPRKLSALSSEELDIEIQQKSQPPPLTEESNTDNVIKNASNIGHSSVEDAAAALRLYWHKFNKWEQFLGYPLRQTEQISQCWPPLKMYLDGCNLPIGMRGVDFKTLMGNSDDTEKYGHDDQEKWTMIPSKKFRLTSRNRDNSNHNSSNISTIDWIPAFQSVLLPQTAPKLESISVMFDGAKFSNINSNSNGKSKKAQGSLETRVFCLDSSSKAVDSEDHGSIRVEITEDGDSADDVLVHRCCSTSDNSSADTATSDSTRKVVSLDKVIDILSSDKSGETDVISNYIVIQRKAGGTKTHKKLFDKLHLRRPDEGALCLSALTPGLRKHSLKIARELQRERSVERVIQCELRRRDELRFVVVTDDVLLTDRLVRDGVLVLSYLQMTNMF